ncbi:helix-turn-helix domain-containing protein [Streptosporangium sp. OZ121]|uniref:helix-turn-helix domain-containing protein n=1 Tax=Streptosporangium sp. OZ121 TaxID=3444183 RepID=UPI003F79A3D9
MTFPPETPLKVSPRHHFGQELRRLRNAAQMSQKQLARLIPLATSQLSMIETGARPASPEVAAKLDEALGTGTTLVDLLETLDRAASQVPRWFRPWVEFEQEATELHVWELAVMPGLLQTEGYARALIGRDFKVKREHIDELVDARMERQEILRRDEPPMLWIVVDEAVLQRPIGSPEVMSAQLKHLLDVGDQPNISLQVLPFTAHSVAGLLGAFAVAELPAGAPPVAYVESQPAGNRITERTSDVRALAFRHSVIRSDALSRRESLNMIKERINLWT